MLFAFIVFIIGVTVYSILTNRNTPEERDEMLSDKEMWP